MALHLSTRGRALVAVGSLGVAVVASMLATPSNDAKYGALNTPTAAYGGPPLTVTAGAHLRLSPRVLEEEGSTNQCAAVPVDFTITPTAQTEPTPNGIWYALRRTDLPTELQQHCQQRPLIWVNQQGVRAS